MKAYLFWILLLFPWFVVANNQLDNYGRIRGNVSTSDGFPAAYVSVVIKNVGKGTVTDDQGNFELKKIAPGSYNIRFSLLGSVDSVVTVRIRDNETLYLNVKLERSYSELEKVLVAASLHTYVYTKTSESLRLNLPLIEVPQNIIVIPHQLLQDMGLLSTTQAMRNASGVAKTYGDLNDYSLSIRGTNATFGIFRNGIGGDWINQQEDVAMIDRIEVLKGPTSFMGSLSEPGGIVNIVTKQPTKERMINIEAGVGSYNLMRIAADLGGSLNKNKRLYYRFVVGVHKQHRDFNFGQAYRYFICPVLSYDFSKKTTVTAEFNYMRGKTSGNNNDLPALNGRMFSLPRDFAVSDPATDAITVMDACYRLRLKHDFNDRWHLNVQAGFISGPWGGRQLYSVATMPVSNDTMYRGAALQHYINYSYPSQAFIDGRFKSSPAIEHKVLFGLDFHDEGSKGWGGWKENGYWLYIPNPNYYVNPDSLKFETLPPGHEKTRWIALYIQDHIKIAKKLIITLAGHFTRDATIRYWEFDNDRKLTDNVFTPRAGLTWLFSDLVSAYVLYDQCFLPQSGRNFHHDLFKPLTGYDIETGMKGFFFNRKLSLNLSVFDIVKNNVLTADPDHSEFQKQTGQIVSKGIDLDVMGNITPSILVAANGEIIDAKVTRETNPNSVGVKNFLIPEQQANLWIQYKLLHGKLKDFSFSAGYQFTGKRGAVLYFWNPDKTKFLPAYSLFDAAIGYSNEQFNIGFNIYNISNKKYPAIGYLNPYGGWRYTPGLQTNYNLSFGVNLLRRKDNG